jgi:hypothetical protein
VGPRAGLDVFEKRKIFLLLTRFEPPIVQSITYNNIGAINYEIYSDELFSEILATVVVGYYQFLKFSRTQKIISEFLGFPHSLILKHAKIE